MNKQSHARAAVLAGIGCILASVGCNSPYHSDQGALFGGLTGAGLGALVGNASGHTGAGAAIGAAAGALTGAAVGSGLDDIEARNRAEIEARLGHPVGAGAVTIDDVIAMTRSGVSDEVIINHVHAHGMVRPLQAGDLIMLQQQGVSSRVVQVMQEPPGPGRPVVVQAPPPPPYWGPYPYYYRPCYRPYYRRPAVSWGVTFGR